MDNDNLIPSPSSPPGPPASAAGSFPAAGDLIEAPAGTGAAPAVQATADETDAGAAAPAVSPALPSLPPPLPPPASPVSVSDPLAADDPLPVDPALLDAVPAATPFSLRDLVNALRQHHVLVVRLGGVPIAALIAICGALFLHVLFAGLLAAAGFYGPTLATWLFGSSTHAHAAWATDEEDAGGSPMPQGRFVVDASDPTPTGALRSDFLNSFAASRHVLPPDPAPSRAADDQAAPASALLASPNQPPMIGLAPPSDVIAAPRLVGIVPPRHNRPVTLAPPAFTGPVVIGPPAAGVTSPARARPVASAGDAGDPEATGDNEPVIKLMRPGAGGGTGGGQGAGHGDGIDRGPSAADLDTPAVIEAPQPNIPLEVQAKAVGKRVLFEVIVQPDGRAGIIKIIHSSGVPELDAICQATIAKYKFRPAYHDGRPIAAPYQIGFSNGPDND